VCVCVCVCVCVYVYVCVCVCVCVVYALHVHVTDITAREVKAGLYKLHRQVSEADVQKLIRKMDRNCDDVISFDEFRTFVFQLPKTNIYRNDVLYFWRFHGFDIGMRCMFAVFPLSMRLCIFTCTLALVHAHSHISFPLPCLFSLSLSSLLSLEYLSLSLCLARSRLRTQHTYNTHTYIYIYTGETVNVPETTDASYKPTTLLLSGGFAGAISRTATAPFDRIKVLMQAGDTLGGEAYVGILPSMRRVYAESGFRGFFRGNGTNVVKIAPESALKFLAYEKLKAAFSSGRCGEQSRV
jgi:Mitochondrial carrier protein